MEPAVAHQEDLLGQLLRPGLRVDADPGAVLGTGTFGTVVRGRQLAIERPVAIKVLHPWFRAVTEPARLFQDEIRAIGRIDHRNVVRIFDAGVTEDGRLYFVMELVTGPTCQELAQAR
ncbi:MAG TPA: protein kinase [Kofleriaceae bacterium]|nr:protein kinase [Kofleriaceae bacterium]